MDLLNPIPPSELPAEALFARLRGRRAVLPELLAQGTDAASQTLPSEQETVDWVYLHLDRRLRRRLRPYLEVVAMRQLTLALRHRMAGEAPPPVLQRSRLLNPALTALCAGPGEIPDLVRRLEGCLRPVYRFVEGLGQTYPAQGPGGVERQLAAGILRHARERVKGQVLTRLVTSLIDLRNLLAVLKHWRWQVRLAPELVPGGNCTPESLRRVWASGDRAGLSRAATPLAGHVPIGMSDIQFETALLNGIGRHLRRAGRDPLSTAVILDVLWRAQCVAHNRALQQALGAERQQLLTEVWLS